MIVTRFENGIIVHSDGKSVWVNNPIHCVGRFSEIGFEIEPEKYVSFYDPVLYPIFDEERRVFVTAEGIAYILTHECDIANENDRLFNTDVLICPIIPL